MFISSTLYTDVFILICTLIVLVIAYFKWIYQYWSTQKVPFLEPQIPFGNLTNVLRGKEHISVGLKKIYDEMKSRKWRHGGIFMYDKPIYLPVDLDLVRNILTKDFQFFADRDFYVNERDPLQEHLLILKGNSWKNMRAKLTPTFTSGKIKMMFQVMAECQGDLKKRMEEESLKNKPIDIKEVLACFTTNIIGSCAFGLDCNALEKEDSEFRKFGRRMFHSTKFETFKRIFAMTFPNVASFCNVSVQKKDVVEFITNVVKSTIEYREKNNYTRNDFMQLMINLKNNVNSGDHDGKPLTFNEVASQCIVFFAAGFETSSTLMTFAMYELAKNQDIQKKLREEINAVLGKHGNKITYDSIQDMKYLSQVIDETLRKHPPAALTNRKCVQDYQVPGENLVIKKGTTVIVPILGIHYDKDYYPDPEKFDPERFTEENKSRRHHYSHLPFGEGPRNCIGMRFGLLQSKMGLVSILRSFNVTLNKKTQEPIKYKPNSVVLAVEGEVWINAQKI